MAAVSASTPAASASSPGSASGDSPAAAEVAAKATASTAAFPCPICLEAFKDEAYLDTCFHSFCYKCICQWVRIVASKHEEPLTSVRCPLCKTKNLSIIHAFDGESFERWYINQEPRKRRLSDAHELVSQFYNTTDTTSNISGVQQYWEQHKYLRKKIWLETWLRREIQALIRGYALIEYESFEEAQAAIRAMNGTQLLTKTVYVDWAFSRGPIKNVMSTRPPRPRSRTPPRRLHALKLTSY